MEYVKVLILMADMFIFMPNKRLGGIENGIDRDYEEQKKRQKIHG